MYYFSSNLGCFQPLFLWIYFLVLSLLFFGYSHYTYVGVFTGITFFTALLIFLHHFFSLFFRLYNLNWYNFKFFGSFLCQLRKSQFFWKELWTLSSNRHCLWATPLELTVEVTCKCFTNQMLDSDGSLWHSCLASPCVEPLPS